MLIVRSVGKRLQVHVSLETTVEGSGVSFRREVIPVITNSGCNSGTCHGAASGQDGFGLSLFCYDAGGDYQAITRHWVGRRVNRSLPEESLLLKKAVGAVPHTGGKKIEVGALEYQTLARWIREGARDDLRHPAKVTRLKRFPQKMKLLTGD